MKILLACEGSGHSDAVLDEAVRSPWPQGSQFKIQTVVDSTFIPAIGAQNGNKEAQKLVDGLVDRLKENLSDVESVEGRVSQGYPKAEIIKSAEAWPSDLLIVGSRGHKGLKRVFLGSVSHSLLMSVACSVRIARKSTNTGQAKVLIALDESEFSDHVVSRVASRPWKAGSEFLCVTAVPTLAQLMQEVQNCHEVQALENFRNEQVEAARKHLSKATASLQGKLEGASASHRILDGDPREAIVDCAKEWGANLIVTGCKGKNWVDRVLLGSVSEAVATWAECSVEVIKK